jgi:benzoyl-CoA-dihydrodiol lyase
MTTAPIVNYQTTPENYKHISLAFDGAVATLSINIDENAGIRPGSKLKLNSYDLGVDIELHDALQRIRFEHPEVRSVVVTSLKDRVFCSGANIFMLGVSTHGWKVNFCKFTNETRNGIEDSSKYSGLKFVAALNGACAGGGYELALACDDIVLVDDRSSSVSLPEVPLLGVLPGTGGLTRVTDKRHVRHDLAAKSDRPATEKGVALTPIQRIIAADQISYNNVTVDIDRAKRLATFTVNAPTTAQPADIAGILAAGAHWWPLQMVRELDDAILHMRTNELDIGTWLLKAVGDAKAVLASDATLLAHKDHWFVRETIGHLRRTLARLDVSSRSIFAIVEEGTCFVGTFAELAFCADRTYMLALPDDADKAPTLQLNEFNFGFYPMVNDQSRLARRFYEEVPAMEAARGAIGKALDADAALALGLVTAAPDDIDWEDEIRMCLEERAAMSPDALTGLEANLRFASQENMLTRIFGRLTAWQNWIFQRPNAVGEKGALKVYGKGEKVQFDMNRV